MASTNQPGTARSAQANNSVRAKSKPESDTAARKTVFRTVLDNPLSVAWPPVPANIRQQLLDALLVFLTTPTESDELPIAEWRLQEHARRRVRVHGAGKGKGKGKEKEGADELGHGKRAASTGAEDGARKKVKTGKEGADATVVQKMDAETPPGATHDLSLRSKTTYAIPDFVDRPLRMPPTPPAPLPRPKLLEYLSLGINEVTRALETRVRWGRWELGDPTAAPGGGLGAASVRQVEGSVDEGDVLLKKNEKKTRRKDRPTPPADKQVLRPPLDLLHPTSSKTLSRPSYRFLTQGVYAPSSTSLPPYLLPPTEPNPFFRMLANAHQEEVKSKSGSTEAQKPSKRKATVLLPDVMLADDIDSAKEEAARRKVEKQLAKGSKKAVARVQVGAEADEEQKDDWVPVLDIIFVCKPDINPPSLVAHLPTMAAAANGVQQALDATLAANERERTTSGAADDAMDTENSATPRPKGQNVLLIPLDVGAERKLADALALRRVAAIGLSSTAPNIGPLVALIRRHVQPLQTPWLVPHLTSSTLKASTAPAALIPTHVKHLRTTAPLNPKAASTAKKLAKKEKKLGKPEVYVADEEE